VAKGKDKSRGRLSVFKGREARLNKAIFHILALREPLAIYDVHKEVKVQRGFRYTCYASVNKRVRLLEESGYIREAGFRKTKAASKAIVYTLTERAYLAILFDSINLEVLLARIEDHMASSILAEILDAISPTDAL